MSFTRINLVVKPPQDVLKQAIQISSNISKEADTFFVLDGVNFFPHITIYSPEYPSHNLDKVYKKVEEIAFHTKPFIATFTSFNAHLGYVDIELEKTIEWENLHEVFVHKLNPFRENHIREKYKFPEELRLYSELQQKYILDYGYSEIFTAFRPHLTITRLKDKEMAKEVVKKLQFVIHSFEVNTLAAYLMGNNGTCIRLIREFALK